MWDLNIKYGFIHAETVLLDQKVENKTKIHKLVKYTGICTYTHTHTHTKTLPK